MAGRCVVAPLRSSNSAMAFLNGVGVRGVLVSVEVTEAFGKGDRISLYNCLVGNFFKKTNVFFYLS